MSKGNTIIYRIVGLVMSAVLLMAVPAYAQTETEILSPSALDSEIAREWFTLQLQLVQQTPGFSPPVASRAFGYSGVALYEALVPGMPDYQSLAGQLNELAELPQPASGEDYHWEVVANSAMATITRALFPTATEENLAAVDALYEQFAGEFAPTLDAEVFERSETFGRTVAEAIYQWSMSDGGHEGFSTSFPADFVPLVGVGLWVPTPRLNADPQPALQPYWGNNRPFALQAGEVCMPSEPPAYSEDSDSAFHAEAIEVYDTTQNLTPEQEEIALYWADNAGETSTPVGHSMSFVTQILEQEEASLALAAEAYARMGIAVADSIIGCWYAKFEYNLLRPVTYIQQEIDETWMPLLNTPPFPEYPSGHSVQSAAAAVVLTDLFGEDYAFTDHTHDARGLAPRSFASFTEMAEEAGISRLYGGIHYRAAIERGLEQGECIGQQVIDLQFRSS